MVDKKEILLAECWVDLMAPMRVVMMVELLGKMLVDVTAHSKAASLVG